MSEIFERFWLWLRLRVVFRARTWLWQRKMKKLLKKLENKVRKLNCTVRGFSRKKAILIFLGIAGLVALAVWLWIHFQVAPANHPPPSGGEDHHGGNDNEGEKGEHEKGECKEHEDNEKGEKHEREHEEKEEKEGREHEREEKEEHE